MKEAFYFPHDNNAHSDPKLMSVFMETGLRGIWLYWILVELMHQQENGMITFEQYKHYVKWYSSHEDNDINEQLMNTCLTNGLFCKTDDGFVYSKRVLQNKEFREELSKKRSIAWKKSAEVRAKWTSVEQNLTHVEQGKERKGKETKENNTITDDVYMQAWHLSITHDEFSKLEKEYGAEKADEVVQGILNYRKNTKYKSLYLTAIKWIKRDKQKELEPVQKVKVTTIYE